MGIFSQVVSPGEIFHFAGPLSGNGGFFGTLGTTIKIFVDGVLNTKIHTSCSRPIGPGLISGDFMVVQGFSRDQGLLCSVDD